MLALKAPHFFQVDVTRCSCLTLSPSGELFVPDCLSSCNYCSVNLFRTCAGGRTAVDTMSNNNGLMQRCIGIMGSSLPNRL